MAIIRHKVQGDTGVKVNMLGSDSNGRRWGGILRTCCYCE